MLRLWRLWGVALVFGASLFIQSTLAAQPVPRAAAPARGVARAPDAPRAAGGANAMAGDVIVQLSEQDKQMLEWAQEAAGQIKAKLESWLAAKKMTEQQLFACFYWPIPKTDPPKFATIYDQLADQDVSPIQENYASRSKDLLFVIMVDKNGYLPSHMKRYSQQLTGHLAIDLQNNRTKRLFNDRTGITAARNTNPYLLQNYKRDTGEIIRDLSVPITINNRHWGAVRFGYRPTAQ
jgi:hypothetical protein